ncbi:MAG: GSCFA domain-containing protein [Prevotella sp.]|nr:GSCFA domain-containing protein [Prevotella sp.]
MKFRTEVTIEQPEWRISPDSRLLFVGSCFATNIGQRFVDNQFQTVVNPFGVMYNPVSILHTLRRLYDGSSSFSPDFVFLTLGTNHVYRLRETGEIVDNCEKRPHRLFQEEQLTIAQCADALREGAALLRQVNPDVRIILTVSPIRYAKYGFHGSQLSKATLLLAIDELITRSMSADASTRSLSSLYYFPAYEIVNDELRDYRFYGADMLHPSDQAVEYIWQQMTAHLLSDEARQFLAEWQPIRQALHHQPFHPDSEEYLRFRKQTEERLAAFRKKYPHISI